MYSRRRRLGFIVALVALLLLALSAPALTDRQGSRPDPQAFWAHVVRHVDGWASSTDPGGPARDRAWAAAHRGLVRDEGAQACGWLRERPEAPEADPSGRHTTDALVSAYLREVPPLVELSGTGRRTVVAGAWEHLCPRARREATAPAGTEED